jgi:hypothetical protein
MMPAKFPEANIVLTKPKSMTDEQCMSIPAFKGVDDAGFPFFMVAYTPSYEDIQAIKAGMPICVKVLGTGFPPINVFTVAENGEPNF